MAEHIEETLERLGLKRERNAYIAREDSRLRVVELGKRRLKITVPQPLVFPVGVIKCRRQPTSSGRGRVQGVAVVIMFGLNTIWFRRGGLTNNQCAALIRSGIHLISYL
jgi:hypothetical protein